MEETLIVHADGGARGNPGLAASAFVITTQSGKLIKKFSESLGVATNNFAEYKAVLFALEWILKNLKLNVKDIYFYLDSELVIKQLTGKYKIKNPTLLELAMRVKFLEKKLKKNIFYRHIPRSQNKLADYLVNQELGSKILISST